MYPLSNTKAYGDRDVNGSFNPLLDSVLTYTSTASTHVFTTVLPNGGDGDPNTVTGPFTERLTATMNSGILTNPLSPGTYAIKGDFTSVYPDNDGVNDNTGNSPQLLKAIGNINIIAKSETVSGKFTLAPNFLLLSK